MDVRKIKRKKKKKRFAKLPNSRQLWCLFRNSTFHFFLAERDQTAHEAGNIS